ncbi:hypothetical protein [Pseudomonas sp. RA_5y_Pfl1_P24]|uniref:hypothetical protein n=1 Tax=Pseudomonas sp. RA_5y_Pfl1_P24 TaxID=3088706 RepID=UPI0030DC57F9
MTKPFNMALFLSGVLTGSKVTQQRHLRQARVMQAAIKQRWQRDNPWTWQLKHVRWFLTQHLKDHSDATLYYYRLTALVVWKRLGKLESTDHSFIRPQAPVSHSFRNDSNA